MHKLRLDMSVLQHLLVIREHMYQLSFSSTGLCQDVKGIRFFNHCTAQQSRKSPLLTYLKDAMDLTQCQDPHCVACSLLYHHCGSTAHYQLESLSMLILLTSRFYQHLTRYFNWGSIIIMKPVETYPWKFRPRQQ